MQWHKNGMTATLAENFSAKRQSRPEKRICIMKQQKKYMCVFDTAIQISDKKRIIKQLKRSNYNTAII